MSSFLIELRKNLRVFYNLDCNFISLIKDCQIQVALEHLELLPKILEKLTLIEKKLEDSQSKRWMNVKELGKYLGYSADHVYKLKDDIFIEGIHFHKRGKLLFDRIEIDKWVIGADTSNKRQELKNNIDAILNSVLHKKK